MGKILRELYSILTERQRRQMLGLFFMMLLSSALEVMGIGLVIPYIAMVTEPEMVMSKPIVTSLMAVMNISEARDFLIAMTVLLICVFVAKELVYYILGVRQSRFVNQCRLETSKRAMASYLNLGYEDYLETSSSAIITVLSSHLFRTHDLMFSLLTAAMHCVMVMVMSVFVFAVDWKLALLLLMGVCAVILFVQRLVRPKVAYWGKMVSNASTQGNKVVHEAFSCKKEVDVYNHSDSFYESFARCSEAVANGDVQKQKYNLAGRVTAELCCVMAILLFVLFKIVSGTGIASILGVLSAFTLVAVRMVPSVTAIINVFQSAVFYAPSVHAVRSLLDKINQSKDVCVESPSSIVSMSRNLIFKGVSYRYRGMDKDVISNRSFTIMKGQRVGVVGETGKGKTTLVNLMLGLLKPTEGEVLIDGASVSCCTGRLWLNVGYVPQDCALLDTSVYENICFGRDVTVDEFWTVLRMAGAYDFVKAMPEQEHTVIGQNGFRLSGGQRQRLGIARALVGSPTLLVFDEATSALDNQTESAVIDTIYRLGRDYTIIMVAHRLSTLSGCDTILNLDEV